MIAEIYDVNNNLRDTIEGDEKLILLNVEKGETYKEVSEIKPVNLFTQEQINNMQKKELRTVNTASIKVTTTSGKVFDGDEDSQNRIIRAIKGAELLNQTATLWKLADNSKVEVTLDELKEALSLAMTRQSEIWMED